MDAASSPAVLSSATMFDQLSERLQGTLSDLRSRGKLTEADVDKAMREIRLALLEADVNFKVTKQFVAGVREKAIGAGVLESLDPGQMVVKVVNEQLAELMGGSGRELVFASKGPTVILMAGLQGSGKTTATREARQAPAARRARASRVAACDTQRPAAVEQLDAARRAGRRDRLLAGHRARPGRHRRVGARPGARRGPRRADHRHRRPPAHRRRADGRSSPRSRSGRSRTTCCSSSTR